MSTSLSTGFARLVGKDATDEQVRRLLEVKEALGLADNDALWSVLCALDHYEALYREHPARIAEEARRVLADVQRSCGAAAEIEVKRANRKLAEAVAEAGIRIATKRTQLARVQGFAAAQASTVAFGGVCLAAGYTLASGKPPFWAHGTGPAKLLSVVLGAPTGWVVLLLLLPAVVSWAGEGWGAARAPQATTRALAWGLARVAFAAGAFAALVTLLVRVL